MFLTTISFLYCRLGPLNDLEINNRTVPVEDIIHKRAILVLCDELVSRKSKSGARASGGALAPEPPRATRILPASRGARRRRALARRRRAPTGADQRIVQIGEEKKTHSKAPLSIISIYSPLRNKTQTKQHTVFAVQIRK